MSSKKMVPLLVVAALALVVIGYSVSEHRHQPDAEHQNHAQHSMRSDKSEDNYDHQGGAHKHHQVSSTDSEYRLLISSPKNGRFSPGKKEQLIFKVVDQGSVVRSFDLQHQRKLHLIIISHDLSQFFHVHPVMNQEGNWSVEIALPKAGLYRAYADFATNGDKQVIETDLNVSGRERLQDLPTAKQQVSVGDYTVSISKSVYRKSQSEQKIGFTVKSGKESAKLQPYLGAMGHLVAIRKEDLSYLHTHPEESGSGDTVFFNTALSEQGKYRLYYQFRVKNKVRTAEFTINVK